MVKAFPEFQDDAVWRQGQGAAQEIHASVVDSGLRDLVGSALPLRFDMPGWNPAALRGPRTTVYLEGEYRSMEGRAAKAPLLVKVPFERGTIIFTSFHNEKQNSAKELQLLRYLVFAAM